MLRLSIFVVVLGGLCAFFAFRFGLATQAGVVALFWTAVHFLIEPLRWIFYLKIGRLREGLRVASVFWGTSLLTYLAPFKLGMPLRVWLMNSTIGLPVARVMAVVSADGALSLSVWGGLSIASGARIGDKLDVLGGIWWIPLAAMALAGAGAWWSVRVRTWLRQAWTELRALPPKMLVLGVVLLLLDVLTYVARHAALISVVGIDLPLGFIALATVVSVFAGMACLLPMGLIGYDATLVALLVSQGVPAELALAVPILNRTANLVVATLLGTPVLLRLPRLPGFQLRGWRFG